MHFLEDLLKEIINYGILFFEYAGVVILILAGCRAVYDCFRRDSHTRLNLAKGMSTALTFKLGGEILRTVVVQSFSEIGMVGCIIILRAALTFLIHWEIQTLEKHGE